MKNILQKFWKNITKLIDEPKEAAIIFAIVGIIIAISGYSVQYIWKQQNHLAQDFYANVATELLSIAITVLIIDKLYARRAAIDERNRVLHQMASPSNEFALEAVRLVRENNWLKDLSGICLRSANLQHADLSEFILYQADLSEANLADTVLNFAVLVRANLTWANLEGATLVDAKLQGATLELANLQGIQAPKANFQGAFVVNANLANAKLSGATLNHASLEKSILTGVDLFTANLEGTYLNGAILDKAILFGANLKGAKLWGVSLVGGDLRGANFQDCKLGDISLKNAVYDNKTIWAENFQPKQFGAINWDELSEKDRKKLNLGYS